MTVTVRGVIVRILSIVRIVLIACGALAVFVGGYLLVAYFVSRIAVEPETVPPADPRSVTVFILSNGVHTDVVLPLSNALKDWRGEFQPAYTRSGSQNARWLALGWGDKGFYLETPTWADLTPRVAFRAAFGLSTSALHATFYETMAATLVDDETDKPCRELHLTEAQYKRLVSYVEQTLQQTLQRENAGENARTHAVQRTIFIPTNAVYGSNDAFYEAHGSYHLFHTCNTWANNALKSCGQKASLWTPFDDGIFYHYTESH
jgi:uncharacterized protein (TIGR02117 family)